MTAEDELVADELSEADMVEEISADVDQES
jgi:hypothetical protein